MGGAGEFASKNALILKIILSKHSKTALRESFGADMRTTMMTRQLLPLTIWIAALSASAHADEDRKWTNESQVGIVKTSGNSETESYSAKQANSFTQGSDVGKINASYLKTAAENATTGKKEETAFKWDAGLRYERIFSPLWSGFVGYLVESDKYAGYQQKHNTDVGAKYTIAKKENYDVLSEAGLSSTLGS